MRIERKEGKVTRAESAKKVLPKRFRDSDLLNVVNIARDLPPDLDEQLSRRDDLQPLPIVKEKGRNGLQGKVKRCWGVTFFILFILVFRHNGEDVTRSEVCPFR